MGMFNTVDQDGRADALKALLGPPSWPASATQDAPALDLVALAREIHKEVNVVREAHGLSPLAWTEELAAVAQAHSQDMADHAYFGHTNRRGEDPGDRARQVGISDQFQVGSYLVEGIGENLFLTHLYHAYDLFRGVDGDAYVFDWKAPQEIAREAVESWMQSPAHQANLLSPLYQGEAIGIVQNKRNETLFVTQNFSCRSGVAFADSP